MLLFFSYKMGCCIGMVQICKSLFARYGYFVKITLRQRQLGQDKLMFCLASPARVIKKDPHLCFFSENICIYEFYFSFATCFLKHMYFWYFSTCNDLQMDLTRIICHEYIHNCIQAIFVEYTNSYRYP